MVTGETGDEAGLLLELHGAVPQLLDGEVPVLRAPTGEEWDGEVPVLKAPTGEELDGV